MLFNVRILIVGTIVTKVHGSDTVFFCELILMLHLPLPLCLTHLRPHPQPLVFLVRGKRKEVSHVETRLYQTTET